MQLQRTAVVFIIFSIVFVFIDQSAGKVQQGTLNQKENFIFLDNFAFGTGNANLEYEISFSAKQPGLGLVLFDDTIGQWGSIRPHEGTLTCSEKVSKITESNFKISLTDGQNGCEVVTMHKEKWLSCKGNIDFSTAKTPRHYFLHLTNCNGPRETSGIWNLQYKVHMTNGRGPFVREFSFDQRYILETDIGFLITYLGILVIGTANHIALSKKHFLHVTYRLFYLSLLLQVISLLLHCCAWGKFSHDGLGLPEMTDAADIIYCLSSILFVVILLLVSKGYSITRVEVSLFGSIKLTVFTLLYAAAYMMMFLYQNIIFDPRDIQDFYGTLAASGLIACRLAGFLWTLYGVIFTIKDHPSKIPFYLHFGAFFAIWYLSEPVSIFLAAYVIPKLDCAFISNGVQWATALLGHAYFLFLTRPGSINKRFPFHLPTRKVDASLSFTDLDSHPHYTVPDDFFDIFTVGQPATVIDMEIGQITSKDCKSEPQHFLSVAPPVETKPPLVDPVAATAASQPTSCPVHLFMADVAWHELQTKAKASSSSVQVGNEPYELSSVVPFDSGTQGDDISDDISVMSLSTVDDSNAISPITLSSAYVDETQPPSPIGVEAFNKPLPRDQGRKKLKKVKAKLPKLKVSGMAKRLPLTTTPVQVLPPVGKQTLPASETAGTEPSSIKPEEKKKPKHLKKLVKKAKRKLHSRQKEAVPTITTYLEV